MSKIVSRLFIVGTLFVVLVVAGCSDNVTHVAAPGSDNPGGTDNPGTPSVTEKTAVRPIAATGEGMGKGQIPHLVNPANPGCLACHENEHYMLLMADHKDRKESDCLGCHKPMD